MEVKITKKFEVKEPVKPVWSFLSDPRKVVACVPGAQIIEALDERRYIGTVNVKVGPMVSSYKGELVIERLDDKNFVIELVGKGLDSRGKGSASMKMVGKLRALSHGGTEVTGSSEITVTGFMAQFGSRVIEEISNQMFEQFTQSLQENLSGTGSFGSEEKNTQPLKAIPLLATASKTAVLDFLRRVTGRSRKDQ
ncbi:MAG: SRPBCC family protein [Deltaproteobacteria bacterium]|nr:SRPBCC family protein [Deltaproteobacteria bacterium]